MCWCTTLQEKQEDMPRGLDTLNLLSTVTIKGCTYFLKKLKRDKNRVAIKGMEITDTSGVALTGGYIVKIDKLDGEDIGGWNSPFLPFPGAHKPIFYQYHEPKNSKIVPEQKNYIRQIYHQF